jgi:hypothetical protein
VGLGIELLLIILFASVREEIPEVVFNTPLPLPWLKVLFELKVFKYKLLLLFYSLFKVNPPPPVEFKRWLGELDDCLRS